MARIQHSIHNSQIDLSHFYHNCNMKRNGISSPMKSFKRIFCQSFKKKEKRPYFSSYAIQILNTYVIFRDQNRLCNFSEVKLDNLVCPVHRKETSTYNFFHYNLIFQDYRENQRKTATKAELKLHCSSRFHQSDMSRPELRQSVGGHSLPPQKQLVEAAW